MTNYNELLGYLEQEERKYRDCLQQASLLSSGILDSVSGLTKIGDHEIDYVVRRLVSALEELKKQESAYNELVSVIVSRISDLKSVVEKS